MLTGDSLLFLDRPNNTNVGGSIDIGNSSQASSKSSQPLSATTTSSSASTTLPVSSPSSLASSTSAPSSSSAAPQSSSFNSVTTFFTYAVFKKQKLFRSLVPYLHIISMLVWLFGKMAYIFTLFHLYASISGSETEPPTEPFTSIWIFYLLMGSTASAIGIEWLLNFAACSIFKQEQIPLPKNISTLESFIQQQIMLYTKASKGKLKDEEQPSSSPSSPSLPPERFIMTFVHPPTLLKLGLHTIWTLVAFSIWMLSFKILYPMRTIMIEHAEYLIAVLLAGSFGWMKKNKLSNINPQNFLLLLVALFLYSLSNDHMILTKVYKFRDVFLPNIQLSEFGANVWGILLLLVSLCLNVLRKNHSKKISQEVFPNQSVAISQHRLFWISISLSAILMIPLMIITLVLNPISAFLAVMKPSNIYRVAVYGTLMITIPYFCERLSKDMFDLYKQNNTSSSIPLFSSAEKILPPLSWRIVTSFVLSTFIFGLGCHFVSVLATPFLVLSIIDMPFYGAQSAFSSVDSLLPLSNPSSLLTSQLQAKRGSGSITDNILVYIRFIMSNRDSRYLFLFLMANIFFMFVELIYGIMSNSLGLISDSAHMLFDCGALAIGLYGAFMSKWKPDSTYTYGFMRFEVLSGFVNGILLVFIAFYIFIESFHRLFDPPKVEGERLLLISVLGFMLNLLGVIFFHQDAHGEHKNDNMYGVYLHMLADTLGSVGVIISTIFIQWLGWHMADPVCSLAISCLILSASVPLLSHSISILMQRSPQHMDEELNSYIEQVQQIDGVLQVYNTHFWVLNSSFNVGSCHIKVKDDINDQIILKKVLDIFRNKLHNFTVQIEKSSFYDSVKFDIVK